MKLNSEFKRHGVGRPWPEAGRILLCLGCLIGCTLFAAAGDQEQTMVNDQMPTSSHDRSEKRDRVVFMGDSLTAFGSHPGGYVTLLQEETGPGGKLAGMEILHSGIPGNKAPDLLARWRQDVLPWKPDTVYIFIGVNDVWHWEELYREQGMRGSTEGEFRDSLAGLVTEMRSESIDVVFCTPAVIGEMPCGENPMDARLDIYARIMREMAESMHLELVDVREAFCEYLEANNPKREVQGILTEDGVHLNGLGNGFLAGIFLRHFEQRYGPSGP